MARAGQQACQVVPPCCLCHLLYVYLCLIPIMAWNNTPEDECVLCTGGVPHNEIFKATRGMMPVLNPGPIELV